MRIHAPFAPGIVLALPIVLALAGPAHGQSGDPVYDNGAYLGAHGMDIATIVMASDFTLGSAATVRRAVFWTVEAAGHYDGSFSWFVYQDDGSGYPGAEIASGQTAPTTRTSLGQPSHSADHTVFENHLPLGSIGLDAGVTYWLALHSGSLSDMVGTVGWGLADLNGTGPIRGDGPDGGFEGDYTEFENASDETAFLLYSTEDPGSVAPEPLSLLLLGTGLAGVGAARRRRERHG